MKVLGWVLAIVAGIGVVVAAFVYVPKMLASRKRGQQQEQRTQGQSEFSRASMQTTQPPGVPPTQAGRDWAQKGKDLLEGAGAFVSGVTTSIKNLGFDFGTTDETVV